MGTTLIAGQSTDFTTLPIGSVIKAPVSPGPSWVELDNSILAQASYPALFSKLGVGAGFGLDFTLKHTHSSGQNWMDCVKGKLPNGDDVLLACGGSGMLSYSTDNGENWTELGDIGQGTNNLFRIAWSPDHKCYLAAGGNNTVFIINDGLTAATSPTTPPAMNDTTNIKGCVYRQASNEFIIYGGQYDDLAYSSDGGDTWTTSNGSFGGGSLLQYYIRDVQMRGNSVIAVCRYVGTSTSYCGIYYSANGKTGWTGVNSDDVGAMSQLFMQNYSILNVLPNEDVFFATQYGALFYIPNGSWSIDRLGYTNNSADYPRFPFFDTRDGAPRVYIPMDVSTGTANEYEQSDPVNNGVNMNSHATTTDFVDPDNENSRFGYQDIENNVDILLNVGGKIYVKSHYGVDQSTEFLLPRATPPESHLKYYLKAL